MTPRMLVFFLDGVGLGDDDSRSNPLAATPMPGVEALLEGRRLVAPSAPFEGQSASLLALDACLGVAGIPQSASGQAALLSGLNVPRLIGEHYGPKPNQAIRAILQNDNLFLRLRQQGRTFGLLNAYPPQYFETIRSGRRMHAAIPYALTCAGADLGTAQDLQAGRAFSADVTGAGWAAREEFPPAAVYRPSQAGRLLAKRAQDFDLAWFDYWPTDIAGHRASMPAARRLLSTLDRIIGGIAAAWDTTGDLFIIVSDHGNLEDLQRRGHTTNPVPALLVGPHTLRRAFAEGLHDLTGFSPSILRSLL
jgi:2,3-bisphosphoglycerate-independent phosphoglycerate mutase